jgi:hypothetical protein
MSNYKAIISKISHTVEIPKANNVQIGIVLGEPIVISKDWNVGDIGVFFCAGTELSKEYCSSNNLYRDSSLNSNPETTGFFDSNGRVKAQPFLKVRSCGYFSSIESLDFTGYELSKLKLGDSFEDLGGVPICRKYENEALKKSKLNSVGRLRKKVEDFKEHINTSQYQHQKGIIKAGDTISIQAKVHGTSARYGYHKVEKQLTRWQKFINKFVSVFPTTVYEYVVGTRKVVLADRDKVGFHGPETYRFDVLDMLKPYLTKGMTIYGEIAGYANSKPIMSTHSTKGLKDKSYTRKYGESMTYKYGCVEGESRFHVYRITLTTAGGDTIDFTQPQLVEWCEARGISPAMDLIKPVSFNGDMTNLDALVEELTERPDVLTEDYIDPGHISEGVIIRVDSGGLTPTFLKSKSYAFKVLEGIASEDTVEVEDLA